MEYSTPVKTVKQEGKYSANAIGIHSEPNFTDDQQNFIDSIWAQVFAHISMYILGWWPILHILFSFLSPELNESISIHIGMDILGFWSIYELVLFSALGDGTFLDGVTLAGIAVLEAAIITGYPVITAILIAADAAATNMATMGWAIGLYAVASVLTGILMSVIFFYTTIRAWNGEINHGTAWSMYALMFATIVYMIFNEEPASGHIAGRIISWAKGKFGSIAVKGATEALRTGKYFMMLMIGFLAVMTIYHLLASS